MTETKAGERKEPEVPPEERQESQPEEPKRPKERGTSASERPGKSTNPPLTIFYHWCKACNICIAYCPHEVFVPDREGKPIIKYPDKCNQCAFCWLHCPDLAIVSNEK